MCKKNSWRLQTLAPTNLSHESWPGFKIRLYRNQPPLSPIRYYFNWNFKGFLFFFLNFAIFCSKIRTKISEISVYRHPPIQMLKTKYWTLGMTKGKLSAWLNLSGLLRIKEPEIFSSEHAWLTLQLTFFFLFVSRKLKKAEYIYW